MSSSRPWRRQWSQAMKSGLRAVAPQGAGSGGTVKTTRPVRRWRSAGQTTGAVSTTKVDPAQPCSCASCNPGVAAQSSSRPGQTTSVVQPTSRPLASRTLGPAGSTPTTWSSIQVAPSGITFAAGRSRDDMLASPEPT
ncbi:hypothetical protein QWJ41_00815 [Nocardioides sp. SOB44]|uniref:Uncharacterized protein n=1 Tax=Nocardioides cremeus TaxID=3058044 RepID=A0ABT8TJW5_9ACTN|nr:hypothetical protein [Nocardioides cremeus]MDO3394253.1 hypothetical protein [Nocardioides cremeus]